MNTLFPYDIPRDEIDAMVFRACIRYDNHNNATLLELPVLKAEYALTLLKASLAEEIRIIGASIRATLRKHDYNAGQNYGNR